MTSSTWSPILKQVIGLAVLDKAVSELGSTVRVDWMVEGVRETVAAKVVPLPFLDLPRRRA